MSDDAEATFPAAPESDPVRAELYRIRGETVSVGAAVEWILWRLVGAFTTSKAKSAGDRWADLKRHLNGEGDLAFELKAEVQAVGQYFRPRELAAHAPMVIAGVGGSIQIFRLLERGKRAAELVTVDQLRAECNRAREGHRAIQAIGRALDDRQPSVLGGAGSVVRMILLGRA